MLVGTVNRLPEEDPVPNTQTVVVGNLTRDPDVRQLPDGTTLAEITIAENKRRRDTGSGEWRDVRTTFWTVTCWRLLGIHVAASLRKGDRVVVTGETFQDDWIGSDGQPRRTLKIDPVSVAVDLARAPARVVRQDTVLGRVQGTAVAGDGEGWASGAAEPAEPVVEEHPPYDADEAPAQTRVPVAAVPASEA